MASAATKVLSFLFWIAFTITFAALLASCASPNGWVVKPGNAQTSVPSDWQNQLDKAASVVSTVRDCGSTFGGTVYAYRASDPISCPNPSWNGCTLGPDLISIRILGTAITSSAMIWELCNACAENRNRAFSENTWTVACDKEATALYFAIP